MKGIREKKGGISQIDQGDPANGSAMDTMVVAFVVALISLFLGLIAANIFTGSEMYIIWPMIASVALFVLFSYVLRFRIKADLFGEIGFIYMTLSLAYTIIPAVKFLMLGLDIPPQFDVLNFAALSPRPTELGAHFWRHVLFISGVGTGYLAVRRKRLTPGSSHVKPERGNGCAIVIIAVIVGICICALMFLTGKAFSYHEHYMRLENLSWFIRRFVYICLMFKNGGYFILLGLMFRQYRKYRLLIFAFVPLICAFEIFYSRGSRIVAFTILLAFAGFYHFCVTPISIKKGAAVLIILAVVFSGVAIIRHSNNDLGKAQFEMITGKTIRAAEFDVVFMTGFHLYDERRHGTLPPRDWQMFFQEFFSMIPFIDHTKYRSPYWYARNYFPNAFIPPTTMGIIADSAIWGGEFDLLIRSLINGGLFALLMRWFLKRRRKLWALTIYIYCYATCILTLKYSLFIQLPSLVQELLLPVLFAGILLQLPMFRAGRNHDSPSPSA